MTVDPRIAEILAARKKAETAPNVIITQSLPANGTENTNPPVQYVTDEQLAALLDELLPGITASVETAISAFKARKISIPEAINLGTTITGVVSTAIKDGAPLIKGQSARTLVIVIFSVLFDRYLAPMLPVWLKPFSGLVKATVIKGLESLYQAVVKKKK